MLASVHPVVCLVEVLSLEKDANKLYQKRVIHMERNKVERRRTDETSARRRLGSGIMRREPEL